MKRLVKNSVMSSKSTNRQNEYEYRKNIYLQRKHEFETLGEDDNNDVLSREERMNIAKAEMDKVAEDDVYSADAVDDIESEFQRIDRSGTDEEVAIAAIMYNLGTTMREAREILPTLSENKLKDYVDYYYLRDLPTSERVKTWKNRKNISSSSDVKASNDYTDSDDEYDASHWKEVASKQVIDSDGFLTDYTMYTNGETYICMFGDKDVYEPDASYADYETEDEKNAWDWFNTCEGFADDFESDEDYDIYSSQVVDDGEDDLEHPNQEFGSAKTSINSTKLPAIFKMVSFEPDTINLDMGGGKFDNATEYLSEYNVTNLIYDPYNRSKAHNSKVVKTLKSAGGADTATCSNVLNVIKEPEARIGVLENMSKLVKPGGDIYITVYEGRGDSNEGRTKSGYQLNRKTADYLDEIQEVFPDARRRGKLIIATNSGSVSSSTSIRASSGDSAYYDTSAILDKLRFDVTDIVDEIVRNYLGYDGADADTSDYYAVEVTQEDHTYARIEVRAEVDYEGLEDLDDALNDYVADFDSDAYFEPVDPGITECYINWRKVAAALG